MCGLNVRLSCLHSGANERTLKRKKQHINFDKSELKMRLEKGHQKLTAGAQPKRKCIRTGCKVCQNLSLLYAKWKE